MFGSGRIKFTQARLIAIALALATICTITVCASAIGWGLSKSAEYQREADYHAADQAKDTYDYVERRCITMTPLDKANCLTEATDKRRAYKRDEQDLVAQRQSALWAYIMGAAAVVGVGLSAVGVLLVYTTFAETKESNVIARMDAVRASADAETSVQHAQDALLVAEGNAKIAREQVEIARDTAVRQLRAYLEVSQISASKSVDGSFILAQAVINNAGQTFAQDTVAHISMRMTAGFDFEPIAQEPYELLSKLQLGVLSPETPQSISYKMPLIGFAYDDPVLAQSTITIQGVVWYTDTFGYKRETGFCGFIDNQAIRSGILEAVPGPSGNHVI